MWTTVSLDPDVLAAVEKVRTERRIGFDEAVNDLIRNGLPTSPGRQVFHQRSAEVRLRIDVSKIADTLDSLDGPESR